MCLRCFSGPSARYKFKDIRWPMTGNGFLMLMLQITCNATNNYL